MKDVYRTKSLNREEDLIIEFLMAYYAEGELPGYIFIPLDADTSLFSEWLQKNDKPEPGIIEVTEKMDSSVEICGLLGSRHKAAAEMANHNAQEDIRRRIRERGDLPALEELKNLLGMDTLPVRIEGFDIAHIGGNLPVASLISFFNGSPDKKNYRYFRLKTTDGIIDDFASMKEAAARRYTRLVNSKEELPDLILIDGGIGQVNAVQEVLNTLHVDIPIMGLAKKDEEIYLPHTSKPIQLPKRSDALRLLQRIRDETHRFATTRNQKLRTKENTENIFLQLPHIGEKKASLLMQTYTSLENLMLSLERSGEEEKTLQKLLSLSAQQVHEIVLELKVLAGKRNEKIQKKASHPYAKSLNKESAPVENIRAKTLADLALASDEEHPCTGM